MALFALAGALGGVLPDADHPGSPVGRLIPWPGRQEGSPSSGRGRTGRWWFTGTVWHRGQMHSVGFAVIVFLLVLAGLHAALASNQQLAKVAGGELWIGCGLLALAVGLGYLSHLALDLVTPSPQMLFWPVSSRYWRPRSLPSLRSHTVGERLLEILVMAISALVVAHLFGLSLV